MQFRGRVWKFDDDIDTDVIIPARHLMTFDAKELAEHVMEDVDPEFAGKVQEGDIIVAGKNFGCGSSREHAPIAIKGAGVSVVLAKSYARIFYRNGINIGLPLVECPDAVDDAEDGDILEIDTTKGWSSTRGPATPTRPNSMRRYVQEIVNAGGLMEAVSARVQEREQAATSA